MRFALAGLTPSYFIEYIDGVYSQMFATPNMMDQMFRITAPKLIRQYLVLCDR